MQLFSATKISFRYLCEHICQIVFAQNIRPFAATTTRPGPGHIPHSLTGTVVGICSWPEFQLRSCRQTFNLDTSGGVWAPVRVSLRISVSISISSSVRVKSEFGLSVWSARVAPLDWSHKKFFLFRFFVQLLLAFVFVFVFGSDNCVAWLKRNKLQNLSQSFMKSAALFLWFCLCHYTISFIVLLSSYFYCALPQ